jgi:hypothetical protein
MLQKDETHVSKNLEDTTISCKNRDIQYLERNNIIGVVGWTWVPTRASLADRDPELQLF